MKKTAKKDKKFDFRSIQTFEDACKKEGIDASKLPGVSEVPEEFRKHIIAYYKLIVIFKAINNGWIPNWSISSQFKYYPWFSVLSSGFGFSHSICDCDGTATHVGSRLCTDTSEKALYIATQFNTEYKDLFFK